MGDTTVRLRPRSLTGVLLRLPSLWWQHYRLLRQAQSPMARVLAATLAGRLSLTVLTSRLRWRP